VRAYVDAAGDVRLVSFTDLTLEEVQASIPAVTALIQDPAGGLAVYGQETALTPFHHRLKEEAEGHVIGDFSVVWVLDPLKIARYAEIDGKNFQLQSAGAFCFGKRFPAYDGALVKWCGLAIMRSFLTFPRNAPTVDPGAPYVLNSVEEFDALCGALFSYVAWIEDSGQILQAAVRAAATKNAIDAVVDQRTPDTPYA
jgi:hypothetical protein